MKKNWRFTEPFFKKKYKSFIFCSNFTSEQWKLMLLYGLDPINRFIDSFLVKNIDICDFVDFSTFLSTLYFQNALKWDCLAAHKSNIQKWFQHTWKYQKIWVYKNRRGGDLFDYWPMDYLTARLFLKFQNNYSYIERYMSAHIQNWGLFFLLQTYNLVVYK